MSILSLSHPGLIYKPFPLFHRRNDSGELDVFEAAVYFSGYGEATGGVFNGGNFTPKIVKEESKFWRGRARTSMDMAIGNMVFEESFNGGEKQVKKKFKQPSSPGGKLASFLSSLFNQTVSKKMKMRSTVQSLNGEEESSGGGRRKRRTSLSHIPSSNTSMTSSSSSDFRSRMTPLKHNAISEYKTKKDWAFMEENFKFINGFSEKEKKNSINGVPEKDHKLKWGEKMKEASEKQCFNGGSVDEDGGESDSSSDLFELEISNLNYCSYIDLPEDMTKLRNKI